MKYLFITLNWVFGVLFSLVGVISLFFDPVPAIPLIAIALFLLPPVREYVSKKTGKSLSVKARFISILVLLVLFSVLTVISQHEKEKRLAEKKLQEQIARFKANKSIILEEIQLAYDNNNYQQVIAETNKYLDLVSDDHELSELNKLAKTNLEEIRKKERSQEILKELKTIPASKLGENKILYQELLSLYPDNPKYKTKFNYYSKKLTAQEEKRRYEAERKKRIENQFSVWNGSHRNLERYIKSIMNDPSSYKHVETVYWDMKTHLVVRTTFRGKNVFGGVVTNSIKAEVSLNGDILDIIE